MSRKRQNPWFVLLPRETIKPRNKATAVAQFFRGIRVVRVFRDKQLLGLSDFQGAISNG
jgi:hypothetical protein